MKKLRSKEAKNKKQKKLAHGYTEYIFQYFIISSPGQEALIYSMCHFPWCKSFHHG